MEYRIQRQGRKGEGSGTEAWRKKIIVRTNIKEEGKKKYREVTSPSNNTNKTCYAGDKTIPYLC